MISIDIHRQRFSKNGRMSCGFVLSPLGNLFDSIKNVFSTRFNIIVVVCYFIIN